MDSECYWYSRQVTYTNCFVKKKSQPTLVGDLTGGGHLGSVSSAGRSLPFLTSDLRPPLLLSEGYNDTEQEKYLDCPEGEYFLQDDELEKKVCRFRRGYLSLCSGLSDTNFGYSEGRPCVLLKLNRVTKTTTLSPFYKHHESLRVGLCVLIAPLQFRINNMIIT